jgi:hypothetical protein
LVIADCYNCSHWSGCAVGFIARRNLKLSPPSDFASDMATHRTRRNQCQIHDMRSPPIRHLSVLSLILILKYVLPIFLDSVMLLYRTHESWKLSPPSDWHQGHGLHHIHLLKPVSTSDFGHSTRHLARSFSLVLKYEISPPVLLDFNASFMLLHKSLKLIRLLVAADMVYHIEASKVSFTICRKANRYLIMSSISFVLIVKSPSPFYLDNAEAYRSHKFRSSAWQPHSL